MLPINYFLVRNNIMSIDNDYYIDLEPVTGNIIKSSLTRIENAKKKIERLSTVYVPFYDVIVYNDSKINIKLNGGLYDLLSKEVIPLGSNSDGEYIFKDINSNSFYLNTQYNSIELEERVKKQVELFNSYTKSHKDIYLYMTSYYGYLNNDNNIRDMNQYIDYFEKNISPDINLVKSNITKENFFDYYYRTDHHWNAYGAKKAYEEIINKMKYSSKHLSIIDSSIIMRGSRAKSSADITAKENFNYINFQSDCIVNVQDENFKPLKIKENKKPFYDYYVSFYNDNNYHEYVYDCHNNKENLLIIGDSFMWSIDYILAIHFNKTFVINNKCDSKFDLIDFVEKNNIAKILIINDLPTTLFDQNNYHMLEKFGV